MRSTVLLHQARRRRNLGYYDRRTLRTLRRANRYPSPRSLLAYLTFRRDLGYRLRPRDVPPLLAAYPRLSSHERWRAAALLSEIRAAPDWIWSGVDQGAGLALAAPRQAEWRGAFEADARTARGRGIAVVGNAGALIGCELGADIDASAMVVRFNRAGDLSARAADLGTRTSVWVASPGYRGPAPAGAERVVVSGPDVCFALRDWRLHAQRLMAGEPVLSVPLEVWRALVKELDAPPSAGVLMLAWLRELVGGWEGINAVGIGAGRTGRYHHAHRGRRGTGRHRWAAEAALVAKWTRAGLTLLPEYATRTHPSACPAAERP